MKKSGKNSFLGLVLVSSPKYRRMIKDLYVISSSKLHLPKSFYGWSPVFLWMMHQLWLHAWKKSIKKTLLRYKSIWILESSASGFASGIRTVLANCSQQNSMDCWHDLYRSIFFCHTLKPGSPRTFSAVTPPSLKHLSRWEQNRFWATKGQLLLMLRIHQIQEPCLPDHKFIPYGVHESRDRWILGFFS
jgi:hypothetical protein